MANLIITVISIALVAVAALMGAYYGGSAFLDGQMKAKVSELRNTMEQIAAALNLYRIDAGVDFATVAAGYPGGDVFMNAGSADPADEAILVPKYLNALPKSIDLLYNNDIYLTTAARDLGDPSGGYFLMFKTESSSSDINKGVKLCKQVAKLARGENATPIKGTCLSQITGKFDCLFVPNGGENTVDECVTGDCFLYVGYRV